MATKSPLPRPPKIFIKEWRQFRWLTQQGLADKVGTSKSLISRYETGAFDMSMAMYLRIVEALDIMPNEVWVRPLPSLKEEQRAQRLRTEFNDRRKADLAEK